MNRNISVDAIRVIAILAVIMIHTTPFMLSENEHNTLDIIINQLCRFAVPFFFIMSGYFWGKKVSKSKNQNPIQTSRQALWRLGLIYIIWNIIYLLPYNWSYLFFDNQTQSAFQLAEHAQNKAINNPLKAVVNGIGYHLWFISALMFALAITTAIILLPLKKYKNHLAVLVGLSLFILGVLGDAYKETPIGIDLGIGTRNGPFFSTLFFMIGYLLSKKELPKNSLKIGIVLTFIGLIGQLQEAFIISNITLTPPALDYSFSTLFYGTGVALIALSNPPKLQNETLAKLGGYTLGIYLTHVIFVDNLNPLDKITSSPLWEITYVIFVFALSLLTTKILLSNKFTKWTVQ